MKKILTLCALALAGIAHAQKPIKVQGIVDDPAVKQVFIQVGVDGQYNQFGQAEAVEVKKGKFTYTTTIENIVPAVIMRDRADNTSRSLVYLVPGEKMKLTLKENQYFYGGSKIYQQMNAADQAIMEASQAFQDFYREANQKLAQAPDSEKEKLQEELTQELMKRYDAQKSVTKKYQDEHAGEEGAVLYLADRADVEELMNGFIAANPANKDSRVAKFLQTRIEYLAQQRALQEKRAREEQEKLDAMKGAPALDFTLNDINGKPLSLSSLRGKYVVLDFWGSWCGWCIKGIPDMKKSYEKYSAKMEILGIDCNDSEDAWKKAVEKYELPWLHVYNPRESTLVRDYNIQGFPTKIVIDPEGNVAKIIVGEDPAFYTYLDELLGK